MIHYLQTLIFAIPNTAKSQTLEQRERQCYLLLEAEATQERTL